MGKLIEDSFKAGFLIDTNGLLPSGAGARVRYHNGRQTVTDGPFAEAREVIGGYAVVECESLQQAIDFSRDFADCLGGNADVEIRQIAQPHTPQ
jgi:hypothetical protein